MKKDKSEYEWLDFSTIKLDVKERFPNIYRNLMENNIDPLKDKVPVVPAQHYTMGGIKSRHEFQNFNEKFICYW